MEFEDLVVYVVDQSRRLDQLAYLLVHHSARIQDMKLSTLLPSDGMDDEVAVD